MATVTDLEAVNRKVIDIMEHHYGDHLIKIVLFGSYARGDYHEDSDVDYLVVLLDNEPTSLSRELSRLSKDLNRFFLATNVRISAKPMLAKLFNESPKLFFSEVRREGIVIYDRELSRVPS